MAREVIPDSMVDAEIERLLQSEFYKLARAEYRLRTQRRQYMHKLRWEEKRGMKLAAEGYTLENLKAEMAKLEAAAADAEG